MRSRDIFGRLRLRPKCVGSGDSGSGSASLVSGSEIVSVHPPSSKITTHFLSAGTLVAVPSTITTQYGTRRREIISFFSPKPSPPQRHHCDTITQCTKPYQHSRSSTRNPQKTATGGHRPRDHKPAHNHMHQDHMIIDRTAHRRITSAGCSLLVAMIKQTLAS